ncbi:alpha/beta fold hydrolase [Ectopseudomonas mendocina]|uniref:Alpha/beta fold hydrolase n=1 Tax=Ectopseudomonas mendocina TaxID=300 RepID=A0ABZ2RCJ3_ECTME
MLRALLLTVLLGSSLAQASPHASMQLPMRLQTDQGTLFGTLLKPSGNAPQTVALLIAGSGPTDRDGNNPEGGRNDSLKRLAQNLAKQGIASLRYDKRGVAASRAATPDERNLSVEAYVNDAIAWSRLLRQDPDFSNLVLIGHSEGALIASLAAPEAHATAVVSLAGTGRPIDQVLREQIDTRLPPDLRAQSNAILDLLLKGQTTDQVPEDLQVLFRPSVQPYLISLLRQDPAQAFARLQVPTLIVQGTHDIQVSVDDALALSEAKPNTDALIVPGMNHVLRITNADLQSQIASYNNPKLPLAAGLSETIVQFIKRNSKEPPSS